MTKPTKKKAKNQSKHRNRFPDLTVVWVLNLSLFSCVDLFIYFHFKISIGFIWSAIFVIRILGFFVACPEFKSLVAGNNSLQLKFEFKSEELKFKVAT